MGLTVPEFNVVNHHVPALCFDDATADVAAANVFAVENQILHGKGCFIISVFQHAISRRDERGIVPLVAADGCAGGRIIGILIGSADGRGEGKVAARGQVDHI